MDLTQFGDIFDITFKIGGLIIGLLVAFYVKPLAKTLDLLKEDQLKLTTAINGLDKLMAVMVEKHVTKDIQINNISKEIERVENWKHELVNNQINNIALNEQRIISLEKAVEKLN